MKKYTLYKLFYEIKNNFILSETHLMGATFNSYYAYHLRISDLLQS